MKKLVSGGNPLFDRKESMKRFDEIVEPVFKNKGFERLRGNSQIMYSKQKNSILITTSCPSKVEMYGDLKNKIRGFKKEYGNDVKIFLLYSRDYSEWSTKPIYQSTLKRIMTIRSLTGISTGLGTLTNTIDRIMNGDPFWSIS